MKPSHEQLVRLLLSSDSLRSVNKPETAKGERTEHLHISFKTVQLPKDIFECLPCIAQLVPDKGLGLLSATITQIINKAISLAASSSF